MKKIMLISCICLLSIHCFGQQRNPDSLSMEQGMFDADWKSLQQYEVPEWFRNAKFGIWAHWGPQCQPEEGDWYARGMYDEGSNQYKAHLKKYGHPSKFGFKDVINEWKAELWNPDSLVALYKRAGAQYFFTLANHHDNFDLWNSDYQEWNSINMGPKRNIVKGWSDACRKQGLYFGVSVHASHTWLWMETAQRSDKNGKKKGVPYDGKLKKADGKGKWWEGYDPQELYAQNHPLSAGSENTGRIHSQWAWGDSVCVPSKEYCTKFYNRTLDLINKYDPDLIYFDDTSLPLSQVSDVGLKIAAHFYNHSMHKHENKQHGVLFAKVLTEDEKKCMTWDVERGAPDDIQDKPWQTCTCIGDWHYNRSVYDDNRYKSPQKVIQMLVDVVSKNGCLLLSIPIRGNGSIDDKEIAVLEGIATWMDKNKEAIFDTRPWKIFGEGPVAEAKNPIKAQGFNEGSTGQYSSADFRFTINDNKLYAIAMNAPENDKLTIRSLAENSECFKADIQKVELLGYGEVTYNRTINGLEISLPENFEKTDYPLVIKVTK